MEKTETFTAQTSDLLDVDSIETETININLIETENFLNKELVDPLRIKR